MRLRLSLVLLLSLYPCRETLNLDYSSDGCKEVLKDLESALDKYQSLGLNRIKLVDKIGWAATNIAPVRNKLMSNAFYLATFNATLARCVKRYAIMLLPSYTNQ